MSTTKHSHIANSSKGRVFITVRVEGDGPGRRLSICGVEGPTRSGDAGCCGQIGISADYEAVPGIDLPRIKAIWERWHLNGMRAGDPIQEDWLREHGHGKDYTETCGKLEAAGLLVSNGYKYGHAWKFEELPEDVVSFLATLPDDSATLPNAWH